MIGVMGALTKALYETDFVEWAAETAELLRQKRFDELDLEHVVEEIADLGASEKAAVQSQLQRLLMHLVKLRIQPARAGSSWRKSIVSAHRAIRIRLEQSPSLRRHLETTLKKTYRGAVKDALFETNLASLAKQPDIPETCPYTLTQLLDVDLNDLVPKP
jgi:hypothetical protein